MSIRVVSLCVLMSALCALCDPRIERPKIVANMHDPDQYWHTFATAICVVLSDPLCGLTRNGLDRVPPRSHLSQACHAATVFFP